MVQYLRGETSEIWCVLENGIEKNDILEYGIVKNAIIKNAVVKNKWKKVHGFNIEMYSKSNIVNKMI